MNRKSDTDKKAVIIDAAYKVLAEQGYDKTSMKEIAREAGVAQGLINYYFPSKEELLFELFRQETCRYCAELQKIADKPVSRTFVRDAMEIPMKLVDEHPEWHRLRFELFAIGLRTQAGTKEIAQSLGEGREQTVKLMGLLPMTPDNNKEALAAIIVAALDGLALQKMSDPAFDAAAAYATMADMLEKYLAPPT